MRAFSTLTNGFLLRNENQFNNIHVIYYFAVIRYVFRRCDISRFILNGFNHIHFFTRFLLHFIGLDESAAHSRYGREKRKCEYKSGLFMPIYDTNETKSKEQNIWNNNNKHSDNKH